MNQLNQNKFRLLLLACALCFGASQASAQVSENARITTRSDVKMSIEGAMGTGGNRLDALARQLTNPLDEVKRCYADTVKEHPEVTGTVQVEVSLPEGKRPLAAEVIGAESLPKKMRNCVLAAFRKVTARDVPRPAKAKVILELTNSAAGSVQEVREKGEEATRVNVAQDSEGKYTSEGKSTQGEVSFRVTARSESLVEPAHNAVRETLPSLFDCRRKAGKSGSPEGELTVRATLHAKAPAEVSVKNTTVKSERAAPCVERALKHGLANLQNGNVELSIYFAP